MAVGTAIAAVSGIGMAIYGAVKSSNDKKDAEAAAETAAGKLENVKEENAFLALEAIQAPDVQKIAAEEIGQGQAAATEALADMGQEGAGQIVNLEKNARSSNLKAAAAQAKVNYDRDLTVTDAIATSQEGINKRGAEAERDLYLGQVLGAQTAAADAQAAQTAAIEGGFSSAGDLAGEFGKLAGDGGDDTTTTTTKYPG